MFSNAIGVTPRPHNEDMAKVVRIKFGQSLLVIPWASFLGCVTP